MAGLLSTTTVLNIHAGGADIDGFSEASSVARNALHGVEIPVWNPIRLGTVWTGAGHTEAEQVVHSNALPQITDTASELVLQHNKDALHQALEDRQSILEVAAGWMLVNERSVVTANQLAYAEGINADIEELLVGQDIDLTKELNLLFEGAELWEPARYLSALRGDLPGLISTSVVDGLEALSKTVTGTELAADIAKMARGGGRLVAGVGVAMFVGDLAAWGVSELAPDPEPTTFTVASGDAEAKAEVYDEDLSHIAAKFYPRGGETIADLAREQRLDGAFEGDATRKWVDECTGLKKELEQWLERDPDPDPQDPDRAYAQGLIDELDSAIGPY